VTTETAEDEAIAATVLDNGLTVVTERMAGVRSVALGYWVGTGSVDEPVAQAGASHFLEHLLFKGTDSQSARDIAETVDAVGGDLNAFTTKEHTAFYLRVLADATTVGLETLSAILWSPAFRRAEVEAERQVILEEILMERDEPADAVHDVLAGALFPGHALGRKVTGDEATVAVMSRDDIAAFHAAHYQPGNVVFAAAGAVDHDAVVAATAEQTGSRSGGSPEHRQPPAVPAAARQVVAAETEQAHLAVGVRGPSRGDEDRHAAAIIDHVLGGGMSSRLFQAIREERGLAYSVYSYRLAFEHTGALAVYAGTSPGKAQEVRRLIEAEMDELAQHGPTDQELDAARSHLRGATALGLEDSGARMCRIGRSQLIHGEVRTVAENEARLAELTPADVRQVARKVLDTPRTVAAVGPFSDGDLD
jgi:predicted Zn-dependent peptidase